MTARGFMAGLDVGTSSVVAVVTRVADPERVAGMGWCPSLGMRKGIVVDMEGAAQAIRRAVEMAREAAGCRIGTVSVGFSGHGVNILTRHADITIGNNKKITAGDISTLMQLIRQVEIPAGRRVLQVIPVEFKVDGLPVRGNPAGRTGSRLSLEARVITADSQMVEQLVTSVESAGLRVKEVVVNSLVLAREVLTTVERELGAVLVDFGGGTTAVTFCKGGAPVDLCVIPVGGEHITSDVAIGVRTSLEAAERMKKEIGLLPQEAKWVELPTMDGRASRRASLALVRQIIESRVLEILDLIKQSIYRLAPGEALPGGVVFTGGGSLLKGLPDLASRILQLPVRVITEGPELQAARLLARRAAVEAAGQGEQKLAVAAGDFRLGARGVKQIFEYIRRGYPRGSGLES
ncbi:cell division protein FtsA [Desulfofundulus australicus DSM 11792]|uniref:Cell division protein FtsA n=1 Tax=Desulfofundulus australicus DSM 11792 TaxID=1121425 RepID=A0A1M5A2H5_9FIRM|nr:cell division protein FtsA [Desulfofundulus australicus]SHF24493.1 cell division protein FtsA [Desulfofundulus australicus DSM 11792]